MRQPEVEPAIAIPEPLLYSDAIEPHRNLYLSVSPHTVKALYTVVTGTSTVVIK